MKKITMICAVLLAFSLPAHASESDLNLYEDICEEIAEEYSVCPELLEALIFCESAGDPRVVSNCGAVGLLQIRPEIHKERMERLGVTDLTDPYQNILVGTDYLMELAGHYEAYEAIVAYNCGEYSKELDRVLEGGSNAYAEKVLQMSADLERQHGK